MKVLVTGGAGYLGSTTCLALESAGHIPVVLDSLVTGPREFVADRIFYEGDIADVALVRRVLTDHPDIAVTIHMAGRVVVSESVANPKLYYRENVVKSLELLDVLAECGHTRVVFSSSASVYASSGEQTEVDERSPLAPGSPYARSKLMVEQVLHDLGKAGSLRTLILRYFNPIGADPGIRTGVHASAPSHVLSQLVRSATGQQGAFVLTGTDYPTRDGTGVRDYVHVWDLARAHVAAVEGFDRALDVTGEQCLVLNVGTGRGVTVRELVEAFEEVWGSPLELREAVRRAGDVAGAFANVNRIHDLLGWRADLNLSDGIRSALQWQQQRLRVLGYS